jgi:AsmA-like C-terminal region
MTRSRNLSTFLLAGAGILLVLLAALVFLAPRLVNTKAFRVYARAQLERRTGVHLSYARAEITLFPHPRVVVQGVAVEVPGIAAGTVATLRADLELIPLLRGEVRNGSILLEDPDFRVSIPPREKPEKAFSLEEFEGILSSLLATLRKNAPATVVTVRNGRLELSDGDGQIVSLRELNARIGFPSERMTLRLRCASPYWDTLSIESSLHPEGLRGDTRVETARFRVRDFVGRIAPGAAPWLRETVVSLTGTIETEGLRKLEARATLTGSTFTVPEIDLRLVEVGGEVSLTGGVLTGQGLSARLGNSRVRGGTLRMGITDRDAPFHAELPADADLAELQPLLRRLVRNERFREEIDRIHEVRGTASGRLTLGEHLSAIRPAVALASVDLSGKHDRVPFPITIRGGKGSYDGDGLSVTDLRGTVGRSTFSGLTGRLDLGETPAIAIRGGTARIPLEEMYPWIASLDGIRESVKPVRSVRGVAEIATMSCDGPLHGPGEWRFETGGSVANLEVDTSLLPGPVTIPRGRFRILPEEISFTEVEATLLDTTIQGGLQLRGYRKGIGQFAASLRGGVGAEAAKWAYDRFALPHPYTPRAPFTVTGSTLSWEKGGAVVVEATLAWPGGADISLSLRKTPETLSVDPLVIRDEASDARVAFHLEPGTEKVKFTGTLSRSTIGKVMPVPARPGQRFRGELEAVLDRKNFAESSARGTLEGDDFSISWKPLAPLAIRHISLSADGRNVRVASSDLSWGDIPFSLTGTAEFGGKTVLADLDVSAGDIDVDQLVRSFQPESSAKPEDGAPGMAEPLQEGTANPPGTPRFPVQGVLRFRAASVSHGSLTWRPVRAEAEIGEDRIRFTLSEANLCGVSTLGTLTLDAAGPAIELAVSATGEDVDATMVCLSGKKVSLTGTYSTSVRVEGKGTGDALLRSLRGPGELTLKDGRINKMTFLSRIFSYLNVTELLRGKFPDLGKEGFPYKTLVIRGEAKDGKFLLGELSMDAPSMGIAATGEVDFLRWEEDLEVLVSPFGTVDAVVRKIPVLGYILGGTLVTIPVTVRGDINDPRVTPLEPAAVGKELLGIVGRTLKAPVHILSP